MLRGFHDGVPGIFQALSYCLVKTKAFLFDLFVVALMTYSNNCEDERITSLVGEDFVV